MGETDVSKRVDAILEKVRKRFEEDEIPTISSKRQNTLEGRLINVLPYLERLKNARVNVGQAEIAAAALLAQPPQAQLAEDIIVDLERRRRIYESVFRSVWHGRSPVAQLLLGILFHAILLVLTVIGLPFIARRTMPSSFDPTTAWVLIGGSLGGITSLLIRLHDFAVIARWSPEADPKVLFFTGLLKPVVSVVFALFVWTAFKSGLLSLNVQIAETNPLPLYFALSFLSGFSERFAPDLANRSPQTSG